MYVREKRPPVGAKKGLQWMVKVKQSERPKSRYALTGPSGQVEETREACKAFVVQTQTSGGPIPTQPVTHRGDRRSSR